MRNDATRYSVQSTDKFVLDDEGGLTITVGPEPIEPLTNYIGTRPGEAFRLLYRVYLPEPEINDPLTLDAYHPPITQFVP